MIFGMLGLLGSKQASNGVILWDFWTWRGG